MQHEFLIQEHHPRLLLFFAGWASDATPFRTYRPEGRDFLLCYDYRTLDANFAPLDAYESIDVVGWSMGVWAATYVVPRLHVQLGQSIALNGTPFPIDPECGIHPDIWQGTLEHLSPASLHKFCRRMCLNTEAFHDFLRVTPHRPVDKLADEMRAISRLRLSLPAPAFSWTQAVVGTQDRIIPPDNQLRAWQKQGVAVHTLDDAHYSVPMFQHYLQDVWKNNR